MSSAKPYTLIVNGGLSGFFETLAKAKRWVEDFNTDRMLEGLSTLHFRIYYEPHNGPIQLVEESC